MKKIYLNAFFKSFILYTVILTLRNFLIKPNAFNQKIDTLNYTEIVVSIDDKQYSKPEFQNDFLNSYINNYLESNSCDYLDYNIFDLKDNRINVFLNCNVPENIIYDYEANKVLMFDDLLKDKKAFYEATTRLLKLKYPKFHVDDIDFTKTVYNIKTNEITGYYQSLEYGEAVYTINYNEIKDLLNYPTMCDAIYENEVYTLNPNMKAIAFTYDDGPSSYDLSLIDLLTDSHSSATFFVVGNRISSYPKTMKKLAESGMEIGNHTYDHKLLTKLSDSQIKEEIDRTNQLIMEYTNTTPKLLRPSYGSVNKSLLIKVGLPSILWSIDTLDWKTKDANQIYEEIIKNASDGRIVLMHSLYESTVFATEEAIKTLYKEGFQIVSVSELAKLKNIDLSNGQTYSSLKTP